MKPIHRSLVLAALCLATSLSHAQSSAPSKEPANAPKHAASPQVTMPPTPPLYALPPVLQGQVTDAEFKKYNEFQKRFNDDPANAKLFEQSRALNDQVMKLNVEISQRRAAAIDKDPEIKAIEAKVAAAYAQKRK